MKKYHIYINNKILTFAQKSPKGHEKGVLHPTEILDFAQCYQKIKSAKQKDFVVVGDEVKSMFKRFKKSLVCINAAGGLVENAKGEFLFIFRNKKWDLPKGKVEKGEKLKTTAVREVEEECGVTIEKRDKRLCKTYHIYELNGKIVLKRTNWYKMFVKGVPKLVPQKEEGITTASWVSPTGVKNKTKNTYPLIVDVLKAEGLLG